MKARGFARRSAAVVSVAMLATAGLVFAVGASAGASSVEKSFEEEGDHEWVVPAGVCSVWIDARGAQGGDAISTGNDEDGEPPGTNPGGFGGQAEAWIAVTPGETLWVNVGERGGDAVDAVPGEGGDNGGGDGGAADITDPEDPDEAGAGGGGASDVRQGGSDLGDRVVVAGGGGGAGGGIADDPGTGGAGGDGGGEEGDDGQPSFGAPATQAGEGGNESEGGDGGVTNPADPVENGDDGELGEGGDGGSGNGATGDGGGGGGGGLYGGGGGGASEFDGSIEDGAGGGGGSGYGPDDTDFENGENEGDGEVTISYDPVKDACAAEAIVIEPKFTG